MIDKFEHTVIFNNKVVSTHDLLAHALKKRDELRKQGKYAMVSTRKVGEK